MNLFYKSHNSEQSILWKSLVRQNLSRPIYKSPASLDQSMLLLQTREVIYGALVFRTFKNLASPAPTINKYVPAER